MASIYKRDKTWAAMLSYQENGRRKRASKTGFSTKSGARAWATAKEADDFLVAHASEQGSRDHGVRHIRNVVDVIRRVVQQPLHIVHIQILFCLRFTWQTR